MIAPSFINHRLKIQHPHTFTSGHSIGVCLYVGIMLLLVLFPVLVRAQPLHNGTTPSGVQDPAPEILGADGGPMVLIPAGEFLMGGPQGKVNQNELEHLVTVDAFFIDKYEVTRQRYAKFVAATGIGRGRTDGCRGRIDWNEVDPKKVDNRAVHSVRWYDAQAYCVYYGKRLPTEAEWEKAARGRDGRIYPWGNNSPEGVGRDSYWKVGKEKYYTGSMAVDSFEVGKSPYGIYGLSVNLAEWVADWYASGYPQDSPQVNPKGPPDGDFKVIRDGHRGRRFIMTPSYERASLPPNTEYYGVGFRCAQDLP